MFCPPSIHIQFSSVQSLSHVWLFAIPWTAAGFPFHLLPGFPVHNQLPKFTQTYVHWVSDSIQHAILCRPILFPPLVFTSVRVFSNESPLYIRWPKYWTSSFSISPSNDYSGLISFRMDWRVSLQSKGLSRVFSSTTVQKHHFFGTRLSS